MAAIMMSPRRERRVRLSTADHLALLDDDIDISENVRIVDHESIMEEIGKLRADVRWLTRTAIGFLVSTILLIMAGVANLALGRL